MKIFFNILFVGYLILIVVSNLACHDETGTQLKEKKLLISRLENDFGAELLNDSSDEYTEDYVNEILKKPIILDSLISDIAEENDGNFVYAKVKSDSTCTILVRLKCNENLFDKLSSVSRLNVLLTAQLSSVNLSECYYEAQTFEKDSSVLALGKEIYLEGECLAANELLSF